MKDILRKSFVCFLILFGFRFFGGTPFDAVFNVLMMLISLLGGFHILFRIRSATRIGGVNYLPYLVLVGISFVLSVLQASRVWGQSLVDGIIANNRHIFVFGLFFLAYNLPKTNFSLKRMDSILVGMMWVNLFIYTFLNLGFSGFEFESISGGLYVFDPTRFQRGLIILGSFYYFHKYLQRDDIIYLVVSLIFFFGPNVFEVQRTQILFIGFILVYLALLYSSKQKTFYQLIAYSFLSFGSGMLIIIYIDPIQAYFSDIFDFFTYAFQAVFQGDATPDSSSTGRVTQFLFIVEKLVENFILGNGLLRGTIQSDITGLSYFHPTDLGLVGAVYAFGLITIPIYIISMKLHFKVRNMLKGNTNLLLRGLLTFEFYLVFESIVSAKIIFNDYHFIAVNLLIISLIEMYRNEYKKSKV